MSFEHSSNSMMGAEGFGSDNFNDTGEMVGSSSGGMGASVSGGGVRGPSFLKRGNNDPVQMLEIGKESEKLKIMESIIAEMAQGNDQSEYFPNVVKLVVSKSLELKKLVYMYLVRYAEEVPDLALLSISTFQKGLADPNQLIRASALRVLSSIRVATIVPIMQIALKQAASDMSPYVRKTAAHALPKLYELAPIEKDNIIEIMEKLLCDRTTMVLGSVVMAFEEICPDRLDLLHKHYRKLCNTLLDIDEWGQAAIINLLVRYARTQFEDPNQGQSAAETADDPFYDEAGEDDDDDDDDDDSDEEGSEGSKRKRKGVMDPDHRLLLRSLQPLLMSRNASVVMAIAQAYHYLAPHGEVGSVAKALIRQLKGTRETRYIVLTAIASMVPQRPGMFEPYLRSFFVEHSDPQFVRLIKLEILTTLANESNISPILREFQAYVKHADRTFVTQTIQCIGRCASSLSNVTESCLQGLMGLMKNKDEAVVAESVVVIKKLLQLNPEAHKEIIVMMSKMASTVNVPMAKASILWLIGEYSSHVPKIAPDVLRQMAQTFASEEPIVKLQIINLAAKLYITNSKQTKLLTQYILNLAKYDMNYDLRDKARAVRALLLTKDTRLHRKCKRFFLSEKPAPNLRSTFDDRARFQIGTMSHVLNHEVTGWEALPEFPEDAPDPTVRDVEEAYEALEPVDEFKFDLNEDTDESDTDDSSDSSDSSDSDDSDDSSGSDGSDDSDEDEDEYSDTSSEEEETPAKPVIKRAVMQDVSEDEFSDTSDDGSGSDSDSGSDDSDDDDDDDDEVEKAEVVVPEQAAVGDVDALFAAKADPAAETVVAAGEQDAGEQQATDETSAEADEHQADEVKAEAVVEQGEAPEPEPDVEETEEQGETETATAHVDADDAETEA